MHEFREILALLEREFHAKGLDAWSFFGHTHVFETEIKEICAKVLFGYTLEFNDVEEQTAQSWIVVGTHYDVNKFILPASEFLPQLLREMRHHPCGISCHMRIFVLEEGDDHLAELRIFCLSAIVFYGTYRLQFLEFLPH